MQWKNTEQMLKITYKKNKFCFRQHLCPITETWSSIAKRPFLTLASGPIKVHQLIHGHFRIQILDKLRTTVQTIDNMEKKMCEVHYDGRVERKKKTDVDNENEDDGGGGVALTEVDTSNTNTNNGNSQNSNSNIELVECIVIKGTVVKEDAWIDHFVNIFYERRSKMYHALFSDDQESEIELAKQKANAKLRASYSIAFATRSSDRIGFTIIWDDIVPGVQRSPRRNRRMVNLNHLVLTQAVEKGERVYGLGEQYTSIEHTGRRVPIITGEQGVGRGKQPISATAELLFKGSSGDWWTTYSAIPHYVTSKARSLFLTNYTYSEFDFTEENAISVHMVAPTGMVCGQIIAARDIPGVLQSYTEYSGRIKPLPEWAMRGVIIGMTGGPAKVRRIEKKLTDGGVKISGFWLQDWSGFRNTSIGIERVWWNWKLDEDLYTDWHTLREEFEKKGTYLATYVNPFLMDSKDQHGDLYRHATENGYFIKNKKGEGYGFVSEPGVTFSLLDLTNPECVNWIENVIVDMLVATKAKAFMADFGEYLPFDATLKSGELPILTHNRYPEDWARIQRRALRRAGLEKTGFFWTRSASLLTPSFTSVQWVGDQLVSWDNRDGIKSALNGILTGGLSGLTLSHSDIGGYTATPGRHRSKELLMRWMELNAFSDAVYRSHQGNRPHHNAQVWDDEEIIGQLAWCTSMHIALLEYKREAMREAENVGLPMTRMMFIHYAFDDVASGLTSQFLLGRDMLIAPVLDRKTTRVHCYLPREDIWMDAWTTILAPISTSTANNKKNDDSEESGGSGTWVTADAPMGWPAVFIRSGASKTAKAAAAALRELAVEKGGVPSKRRVKIMDPVEKLILGLV